MIKSFEQPTNQDKNKCITKVKEDVMGGGGTAGRVSSNFETLGRFLTPGIGIIDVLLLMSPSTTRKVLTVV